MKTRANRGYSLVEVTLALGVISIALVSLLGLLVSGTTNYRESRDSGSLAVMTQAVISELKAQPPAAGTYTYYFSRDGSPQTSPTGAVFTCSATLGEVESSRLSDNTATLRTAELHFTWPGNEEHFYLKLAAHE